MMPSAMMPNEHVTRWLAGLAETCLEDADLHRLAARATTDLALRSALERCARSRATFARDLRTVAEDLGSTFPPGPTVAGVLYRRAIGRPHGSTSLLEAPLASCTLGAEAVIEAYDAALSEPLPAAAESLLTRQCEQIVVWLETLESIAQARPSERDPAPTLELAA